MDRHNPGGLRKVRLAFELFDYEKEAFLDLVARLELTYMETLLYLLDIEMQHRRRIKLMNEEAKRSGYVPCEEALTDSNRIGQDERHQRIQVCLSLTKDTWKNYANFSHNCFPLWAWQSHGEKFGVIVKMAEKYYEITGGTPNRRNSLAEPQNCFGQAMTPRKPRLEQLADRTTTPLTEDMPVLEKEVAFREAVITKWSGRFESEGNSLDIWVSKHSTYVYA